MTSGTIAGRAQNHTAEGIASHGTETLVLTAPIEEVGVGGFIADRWRSS